MRYPDLDRCLKPCVSMEVRTIYTAQVPDDDTNLVMFNFNEKNPVSREVLAYTLLSLVAEVSLVSSPTRQA